MKKTEERDYSEKKLEELINNLADSILMTELSNLGVELVTGETFQGEAVFAFKDGRKFTISDMDLKVKFVTTLDLAIDKITSSLDKWLN